MKRLAISLLVTLIMVMGTGTAYAETVLKVTMPRSFEGVFEELAKNFKEKEGITVKTQSTCSGKAAKEVKDYGMFIDMVISADYTIIDKLLVGNKFADWNMLFAKNEMVLGYTKNSKYAGSVNKNNWYKTILKSDVKFGMSSADDEPCGYRTMMVLSLAEKLYGVKGFKKDVMKKAYTERKSDKDIVGFLTSGKVDYIITYKSYAVEKGFRYIELPKEVNLFSARYTDHVQVENKNIDMDLKKIEAACIFYSLTIPSTVQHREEAVKFAKYIVSNEAAKIMEKHGFFVTCNPMVTGSGDKLDAPLRENAIHVKNLD